MPAGSRFQVIRFGSNVSPVFPETPVVPATEANLARVTELLSVSAKSCVSRVARSLSRCLLRLLLLLQRLEANLGGTELDQPLRIALAAAPLGAAILRVHRRRGPIPRAAEAAPPVPPAEEVPRILGAAARAVLLFTDGEVRRLPFTHEAVFPR